MDGPHGPADRIKEEDRLAVGHFKGQELSGAVRDHGVSRFGAPSFRDVKHIGPVHLVGKNQILGLKGPGDTLPVFPDGVGVVFRASSHVKALKRGFADASCPGENAVPKPRKIEVRKQEVGKTVV